MVLCGFMELKLCVTIEKGFLDFYFECGYESELPKFFGEICIIHGIEIWRES